MQSVDCNSSPSSLLSNSWTVEMNDEDASGDYSDSPIQRRPRGDSLSSCSSSTSISMSNSISNSGSGPSLQSVIEDSVANSKQLHVKTADDATTTNAQQLQHQPQQQPASSNDSSQTRFRLVEMSPEQQRRRDQIVELVGCVLDSLFEHRNDTLPADRSLITCFHTCSKPGITIRQYMQRIAKVTHFFGFFVNVFLSSSLISFSLQYSECSGEVLILALMHINRILHYQPQFELTSLNIHRLLLTSIMVSAKFFDDQFYNNAFFARIGGGPSLCGARFFHILILILCCSSTRRIKWSRNRVPCIDQLFVVRSASIILEILPRSHLTFNTSNVLMRWSVSTSVPYHSLL